MDEYSRLPRPHIEVSPTGQSNAYATTASCVALGFAVIFFSIESSRGLTAWEYGDETQYLVAAQMITEGHHLYRDVFTHHGPLPVILAHIYALLVDPHDFSYWRIWPILMAFASFISVLLSPALKTWQARICAATIYAALLSVVWLPKFLNIALYPAMGGYFSVILISQCILPIIAQERVSSLRLLVGGAAFALAGLAAYPYFLSGAFLVLSSVVVRPTDLPERRAVLKPMLMGAAAVTAGALIWLLIFGDIAGYFIYHIYFNQAIYSKFVEFSPLSVLNNLSLSLTPQHALQNVTIALMLGWILTFVKAGATGPLGPSRRVAAIALIVLGLLLTNPMGDLFEHNNAFIISNFAMFAFAISFLIQRRASGSKAALIAAVATVAVVRWAADLGAMPWAAARLNPEDSGIYRFIRSITKERGDLLSLVNDPIVYIRAARSPASGNIYYLPWQASYNKNAFSGYKIDICSDIRSRSPAVIWFQNRKVWNIASIDTYEPCVVAFLVKNYAPIAFASPWYVRKDILVLHTTDQLHDEESESLIKSTMQRAETVSATGAVSLTMALEYDRRDIELRRLGVLFSSGSAAGEAELILRGSGEATFSKRFSISDIPPDKYHYFELRPGAYRSGEIKLITNGQVSVWNVQDGRNRHACLVYEYVDSTHAYTPMCPLLDPIEGHTLSRAFTQTSK